MVLSQPLCLLWHGRSLLVALLLSSDIFVAVLGWRVLVGSLACNGDPARRQASDCHGRYYWYLPPFKLAVKMRFSLSAVSCDCFGVPRLHL